MDNKENKPEVILPHCVICNQQIYPGQFLSHLCVQFIPNVGLTSTLIHLVCALEEAKKLTPVVLKDWKPSDSRG